MKLPSVGEIRAYLVKVTGDVAHKLVIGAVVGLIGVGFAYVRGWLPDSLSEFLTVILRALRVAADYIMADLVVSIVILALIALCTILSVLLYRAYKAVNKKSEILSNIDKYRVLVEESGLMGRYPHARLQSSAGAEGASWAEVAADILRPDNRFLFILGANGIDTFGRPGSPLYEAMGKFAGTIRVILMDPKSPETKFRAQAVHEDITKYKTNINVSRLRLLELRKCGMSVEGKYYSGKPNWKLIITNQKAWVQYYNLSTDHIEGTPVYLFLSTAHLYNFYAIFYAEFERIWRRCEKPMPLA